MHIEKKEVQVEFRAWLRLKKEPSKRLKKEDFVKVERK